MLLLTSAFALFASTAAVQAAVHQVDVGNGGLTYTPNTVTAVAQDTIVFTLYVTVAAAASISHLTLPCFGKLQQRREPYRNSVDLCEPLLSAYRWCRLWHVRTLPSYSSPPSPLAH